MKFTNHFFDIRFWLFAGLLVADGLFFGLSDPSQIASGLLIVGFGLFAATLYCLIGATVVALGWYGWHLKRPRRLAATLAGLFGGLIALQSIGELSPRDVAVLLPLAIIMYAYVSYGRATASNSN